MTNLENFGVQELNAKEISNTNGGLLWLIPIGLYVLAEWDDISAGFNDGINGGEYDYKSCNC